MSTRLLLIGASLLLAAAPARAGEPRRIHVDVDSGWVLNEGEARQVIFSTIIEVLEAAWLRIDFEHALLGEQPAGGTATQIRLTSLRDMAAQELNQQHLREWQNMSAYFNGDAVLVELEADGGAAPSRILISGILAGTEGSADFGICDGQDDRVPSDDPRVGRGYTTTGLARCTASIIGDTRKCLLAAGHCHTSGTILAQVHFNVPFSTSTGAQQFPHPDHQYAIDTTSLQWQYTGLGGDWSYFGCFPNPNTGLLPYEAQGAAFVVASAAPPAAGQTVHITGNGAVSTAMPPEWNRIQKTSTGPLTSVSSTTIGFRVDATPGNSGSSLRLEKSDEVIGIVTHAGCGPTTGANYGTAIQHPALQNALANPLGVCLPPPCYADCDRNGVLNIEDFTCFINALAEAGVFPHLQQVAHYANCDGSTVAPALNVDDFVCFIGKFAQGCS